MKKLLILITLFSLNAFNTVYAGTAKAGFYEQQKIDTALKRQFCEDVRAVARATYERVRLNKDAIKHPHENFLLYNYARDVIRFKDWKISNDDLQKMVDHALFYFKKSVISQRDFENIYFQKCQQNIIRPIKGDPRSWKTH